MVAYVLVRVGRKGEKMRLRKIGVLLAVIGFALLGVSLSGCTPKSQTTTALKYGAVVDGLQMSLALDKTSTDKEPVFLVTFQNAGEKDMKINLGGITIEQVPGKIQINIEDSAGKTTTLVFTGSFGGAAYAGPVSDYVVPLRKKSTYSVQLKFDQFSSSVPGKPVAKLKSGKYRIFALYKSDGRRLGPARDYHPFWKGKLQSNTISFEQ